MNVLGDLRISKSTLYAFVAAMAVTAVVTAVATGGFGLTGKAVDGSLKAAGEVVEVRTTLQGFEYNPDVITVKKGSRVRLLIDNKDNVVHGLHLPQFGIQDGIQPLSLKTVEFTAVENQFNGQAVPTCSQEHGETLTINVV